jgi:hypothetical protein
MYKQMTLATQGLRGGERPIQATAPIVSGGICSFGFGNRSQSKDSSRPAVAGAELAVIANLLGLSSPQVPARLRIFYWHFPRLEYDQADGDALPESSRNCRR